MKPWLDVEDLLPGEDWEVEIPKALFASDIILVCLSKNSVNKEGYVQKEIAFALDKALEKPEGTIFIIPVKLEDCELPKRLSRYQAVDLFRTDGRKRLLMGLNKRVNDLGGEVLPLKIEETKQRTPKPFKPEIKQEEKSIESQSALQVEKRNDENKITPAIEEKKESAKPFTRILNPFALAPQQKSESKQTVQNYNFRKIGIGGIILISIIGTLLAGNYFLNNLPVNETPEITPTQTTEITVTSTFAPTATATKLLAISTTTRFDIGSTTLGSDGMVLMYVPAGEFTMGSDTTIQQPDEWPEHQVNLDGFWIDQTEVTTAMYAGCVNANQCNPPTDTSSYTHPNYFGNSEFDNYPVIYVSWNDAVDYCIFAGRRLPSEAEWEKAASGPSEFTFPWGNYSISCDNANDHFSCKGDITEVGSYETGKSAYGIYDMAGNVWEWVNDWYDENYYQISPSYNPLGVDSGDYKVLRGGSWTYNGFNAHTAVFNRNHPAYTNLRSSNRNRDVPDNSSTSIGFRCAMDGDQ